jgi:hypothetical protein
MISKIFLNLTLCMTELTVLVLSFPHFTDITYSKGRRDVKHHFIHLSRHPSGRMQLCHPHYLK